MSTRKRIRKSKTGASLSTSNNNLSTYCVQEKSLNQPASYLRKTIDSESTSLLYEYSSDTPLKSYNKKAVVYHLFYPELVLESIETINEFNAGYDKIFTISETLPEEYLALIKQSTSARIFIAQNTGRDLYPFWLLIKQGILDTYELVCKLHGKKSLHRGDGDEWRKLSIEALCGSQKRIQYIENLFINDVYSNLCFIAPRAKALLTTTDRHWLGNLKWLNIISERLGQKLELNDVSGSPIMAGSFYWLNTEGINKFRKLPINIADWTESLKEGEKVDGKLEHFIERSLLIDTPLDLTSKTKAGFIDANGKIQIIESNRAPIIKVKNSLIDHLNNRSQQIFNINHTNFYGLANSHLLSSYKIDQKVSSINVTGYIIDICRPQKRFQICIYKGSSLLYTLNACEQGVFTDVDDVTNGDFCFQIDIPGIIKKTDISIFEKESGLEVSLEKGEFDIEKIETLLMTNRITPSVFIFPEVIRQRGIPLSKYLTGTNIISSTTLGRFKQKATESDLKEISTNDRTTKHVFVVNNPIAEIAVARITESLKLTKDNTLIILHRVNQTSLLNEYPQIHTNMSDVETLFSKDNLLVTMGAVNRILEEIGNENYIFYAHHYNAIFSYVLGFHHLCINVNLIEEGNLSSVPNWEAQHLSKNLQYTNTKMLLKKDSCTKFTNSVLQLIGSSEFEFINYTIIKSHFPNIIPNKSEIPDCLSSIFKNDTTSLEIDQFAFLLLFKRYYLWHPKMTKSFSLFSLSKAFTGMTGAYSVSKVSTKEKKLQKIYKDKLGSPFALILLPPLGRFGMFDKLVKTNNQFTDFFNDIGPGAQVFYIMHPASTVDEASISAAKKKLGENSVLKSFKADDLCDLLGQNPVTEIAATCFKYVIHYGSSLSLVLPQYESETKELYLDTFV